jgi:thiol-disulfide isomerase/thioredoxin
MKKIYLFIALWSSATMLLAQATLVGTIKNPVQGIPTSYIPALRGTFFLSGYKECKLDTAGNFTATMLSVDTPSIVSFYCNNAYWRIYTSPKSKDSIFVDLKKPKDIQFFGANALINHFLNHSLKREKYFSGFADTPTEKTMLDDLRGAVVEDRVTKMRDKEYAILDSFRLNNPIDTHLYSVVKADIFYYHLALFNGLTLSVYKPLLKADDIITPFDKSWGEVWERLMENPDAMNNTVGAATYWYHDYLNNYLDWFRASYKKEIDLKRLDVKKGENIFELEQIARQHFSGKALEIALADLLYEEAIQEAMQPALISIYNRFATDFPNSIYHGYLREALKPIESSWKNDNSNLLASVGEIFLVNNPENINSVEQLLSAFKGKVIYVDLWATWCGPCKQEFQYKGEIEVFGKGKDLEKVFISIDKPEKEQAWLDAVSFYDLNGHHIRANAALLADLRKHYSDDGKGTLTLPRYMIVDKTGKVVVKNANRPSDGEKLFTQLNRYLK